MIEIRKSLEIARRADVLYEYLVQPVNIVDYVGPIRRIYRISTKEVKVGTRLSVEAGFLGIRFTQRAEGITDHPPERFACRSVGGRFKFEAGFTLHPATLVTRLEG